jgi:hypothetical protein
VTTSHSPRSSPGDGKGAVWLVWLVLIFGGGAGCWNLADSNGWVPHKVDTKITAKENWFVGKTKECSSYALDPTSAKALNKPVGSVVEQVDCDDGPLHQVSITFWGKAEQDGIAAATWNCKRESSTFVCMQTGSIPKLAQ